MIPIRHSKNSIMLITPSVDQNRYPCSKQIQHRIDCQSGSQAVLIKNNERIQEVKQQMNNSTIDQISVPSENISHDNAYTYDCSHEGNRIDHQIQRR